MALQSNHDSHATKEVGVSDIAAMCNDCTTMCWEKTARIVNNVSRAPRGWEKLFKSVAEERRLEDQVVCEAFCERVRATCPVTDRIIAYEKVDLRKIKKGAAYPEGVPSVQDMTRCEHAVEQFSNLLFTLAHKPSKVSFATGGASEAPAAAAGDTGDAAPPTEAHRKVLEGGKVDDEIVRRWSAARQGKLHMQAQGILRTEDGAKEFKQELKDQEKREAANRGTTPRW